MEIYQPGTMIGQYEVASKPMMGGMGVVYFCLDHGNDDRPVALKTFRPELLPDRDARDRFLREGAAWVELGSHPHIVRCYKVEYIDSVAFLVLELISKEQTMSDASLRSWLIPGQPLPLEQALLFALQIARGMQYATEKIPGFVHRDLKPENILVGADMLQDANINRLRVTDFGLSTILKDQSEKIQDDGGGGYIQHGQLTQGTVGTPLYMAPEQWKGGLETVATDVYAFGCILYEMLAGERPVNGNNLDSIKSAHVNGKITPLRQEIPGLIKNFVMTCLELNPQQRHANWKLVERDITDLYKKMFNRDVFPGDLSNLLENENRVANGWSYEAIGHSYNDIGKYDVAVEYFKRAISIGQNQKNSRLVAASLISMSGSYNDMGDHRGGVILAEQARTILKNTGDKTSEGIAISSLAYCYNNLGEIERAIDMYKQALVIARENRNTKAEADICLNMGNSYLNQGNYKMGIDCETQSLNLAKQIGDRRLEGRALNTIGNAYWRQDNPKQAIVYNSEALKISQEIGDKDTECNIIDNLGSAYLQLGEIQIAISYFENALTIARDLGIVRREGRILGNLGNAYYKLGLVDKTIAVWEQSSIIAEKIGDLISAGITRLNMAVLYTQQGKTSKALPLAQEAERIFAQTGNPNLQASRQLIAQLQGRDAPPAQANPVEAAFEAFQRAGSLQAMQGAVERYPSMKEDGFIQAVERAIKEQVPPNLKPAFEQRLEWLEQIAGKKQSGLLGRLFGKK